MLWAVMSLSFVGFLRSGQVVPPDDNNFNQSQHLSFGDITVYSLTCPSCLSMNIKQSKTDPFRSGVLVVVGQARGIFALSLQYLLTWTLQGPREGPLFWLKDSRPLSRQRLVTRLREVLWRIEIYCQQYSVHSFHIGTATTAAGQGSKTLHRESVVYQLYVQTPHE